VENVGTGSWTSKKPETTPLPPRTQDTFFQLVVTRSSAECSLKGYLNFSESQEQIRLVYKSVVEGVDFLIFYLFCGSSRASDTVVYTSGQ